MRRNLCLIFLLTFVNNLYSQNYKFEKHEEQLTQNYDYCTVIFDPQINKIDTWGNINISSRFSPCSTFKIVNSVISFEIDEKLNSSTIFIWDKRNRFVPEWNNDLTLKKAFKTSAYWVYQILAAKNGKQKYIKYLSEIKYGNNDVSGAIDSFWQNSTLKISPLEQVESLKRILEENIFSIQSKNKLLDLMKEDQITSLEIYGKTGSGWGDSSTNEELPIFEPNQNSIIVHGWYVGFVNVKGSNLYFCTYVRGKNANGSDAKRFTIEILQKKISLTTSSSMTTLCHETCISGIRRASFTPFYALQLNSMLERLRCSE